jgi:hypothetical protein
MGSMASLAGIIHEFHGANVESKEFHTEGTELRHRDRGEVPEILSVHSALNGSDNANGQNTP